MARDCGLCDRRSRSGKARAGGSGSALLRGCLGRPASWFCPHPAGRSREGGPGKLVGPGRSLILVRTRWRSRRNRSFRSSWSRLRSLVSRDLGLGSARDMATPRRKGSVRRWIPARLPHLLKKSSFGFHEAQEWCLRASCSRTGFPVAWRSASSTSSELRSTPEEPRLAASLPRGKHYHTLLRRQGARSGKSDRLRKIRLQ